MKSSWIYLARRVVDPLGHRQQQPPASNLCHAFSSFSSPFSTTSSVPPPNNKLFVGGTTLFLLFLPFLISTSENVGLDLWYSDDVCTVSVFSNHCFLVGLSWSVNEKLLLDAFSSYGKVTEGNMFAEMPDSPYLFLIELKKQKWRIWNILGFDSLNDVVSVLILSEDYVR